jgi:integration host factor subunit beta
MNVTKTDLCSRVSKKVSKTSITELKPLLEAVLDEILQTLAEGHRIEIRGFGCFKPIIKKRRMGRNPRTGEQVEIPQYTAPVFKFSRDAQRIFVEKSKAVTAPTTKVDSSHG